MDYEIVEFYKDGSEKLILELADPDDLWKVVLFYTMFGLREGVVKVQGRDKVSGLWVCEAEPRES